MIDILLPDIHENSLIVQARRVALMRGLWLTVLLAFTGVMALVMLRFGPEPSKIVWLLFAGLLALILVEPRIGVYSMIFFSLAGDSILSPWYPFTKNLSSSESIMYLHHSLVFSPLEICIVLTFVSWLVRSSMRRKVRIYQGPLFWLLVLFTLFLITGLAYGIGSGGNVNIALWEARPIFYLPAMVVLVSNLIKTRKQLNIMIWLAMAAIFVDGVNGVGYLLFNLKGSLSDVEAITDHSAAVQMNTIFILILSAWFYKASPAKRTLLPIMALPVIITYIATQRRAAFLGLFIALALFAVVVFFENRRMFWIIAPPLAVILLGYTAAFWNSTSPLGLPAQAVKSVVAQNEASSKDQLSNMYRLIENINTNFTIHQAPITGVGFGKKFLIIIKMPDISTFAWWEYITHNSIFWIWMKTGVFGFATMLFLIGYTILIGVRTLLNAPVGDLRAIALTALFYIAMHFVYAYVDMSWDTQSMIYVGAMMGVINSLDTISARKEPAPLPRWSWQK